MAHPVLDQLLTANERFALNHRGTVNHLPMALVALSHMGADEARLKAYFNWWETNVALPRQGLETPVAFADWRTVQGQGAAFAPLAETFKAQIERVGCDRVVAEVAPELIGAPSTLAFHALIRLAYGQEAGHGGETGAGLAAWVTTYRDLDLRAGEKAAAGSVKSGLDAVARAVGGREPLRGSITGALAAVAADPVFRDAVTAAPVLGERLLPELAQVALRLYWQFPNFTVLHMVTGLHAARVLFERFPALATPAAIQALWGSWLAAYATVGAPVFEDAAVEGDARAWPDIFAAAIASDDDHVIKLTYSCAREGERYGDPAHQVVASRVAGLG